MIVWRILFVLLLVGAEELAPVEKPGDAAEEPRQRLTASAFSMLDARFGPFTEFIGAERRHRRLPFEEGGTSRLWIHPAHHTVASGFRLVAERLRDDRQSGSSGVIIVPWDESAGWWPLTKHFVFEGCLFSVTPDRD